jgi:hypothetical protein
MYLRSRSRAIPILLQVYQLAEDSARPVGNVTRPLGVPVLGAAGRRPQGGKNLGLDAGDVQGSR